MKYILIIILLNGDAASVPVSDYTECQAKAISALHKGAVSAKFEVEK